LTSSWQGLMYVQDGVLTCGAVSRESGSGPWEAWRLRACGEPELLGAEYATSEDAQRAVEAAVGQEIS
jgi:hypothetical protein